MQNLSSANDSLDNKYFNYKNRMRQNIDNLFSKLGIEPKNELLNNEVYKSLVKRSGTYKSYITFYYNSAKIRDIKEAKKIRDAIRYITQRKIQMLDFLLQDIVVQKGLIIIIKDFRKEELIV